MIRQMTVSTFVTTRSWRLLRWLKAISAIPVTRTRKVPKYGEYVCPHFYVEAGDGWTPQTLSLWQDLESTMAFAYQGLHGEAMRHGSEWMVAPQWPPYALWWVDADHTPDWREACAKHLQLHQQGGSGQVFTFKEPFSADGDPVKLDAGRIKQIAAANAARLANITRAG